MREWRRFAAVIVCVVLSLVAAREYRLRKEVGLQAENQYQRAFQEVIYHVDALADELGKATAAGSVWATDKAFRDAWRHAESARAGIGQLPVGSVPMSSTEDFLSQVGSFTYILSQKGASGADMTTREWTVLRDLHKQAKFAAEELARIGQGLSAGRVRWVDIQRGAATAAAVRPESTPTNTPSNQVTKSFKMLEDGMTRFPSPDFEGVLPPPRRKLPTIPGPAVSTDEALRIALDFLGPEAVAGASARVIARIPSEPECYRIEVSPARGGVPRAWLDVSVRGGRVLWMMVEAPIGSPTITPAMAETIAADFLVSRGFVGMRRISRRDYQGVTAVGFAYEQDGVLVYPDHVVVRVALDSGRVDGFEGTNYQVFHRLRPVKAPLVTEAQARKALNPRLDVVKSRLAIIVDDFYVEKPVYEFRCKLEGETYLVYVNADTGKEEEVKRETSTGTETV